MCESLTALELAFRLLLVKHSAQFVKNGCQSCSAMVSNARVTRMPAQCLSSSRRQLPGALPSRNYFGVILDVSNVVVETELFPAGALAFYTAFNLNQTDPERDSEAYAKYYSAARGGGQGTIGPSSKRRSTTLWTV